MSTNDVGGDNWPYTLEPKHPYIHTFWCSFSERLRHPKRDSIAERKRFPVQHGSIGKFLRSWKLRFISIITRRSCVRYSKRYHLYSDIQEYNHFIRILAFAFPISFVRNSTYD